MNYGIPSFDILTAEIITWGVLGSNKADGTRISISIRDLITINQYLSHRTSGFQEYLKLRRCPIAIAGWMFWFNTQLLMMLSERPLSKRRLEGSAFQKFKLLQPTSLPYYN
jgi:hypothetical protein